MKLAQVLPVVEHEGIGELRMRVPDRRVTRTDDHSHRTQARSPRDADD